MEVNMIGEAFRFMILGMGIVYLFLIIMIQSIKLQAFIIGKYFPGSTATTNQVTSQSVSPTDSDEEQARVAAVIAAVTDFRKNIS